MHGAPKKGDIVATITGTDELSLQILESFEVGIKVKDIPIQFNVSIDQAKRLSRYYKMLQQSKENLSASAYKKVKGIGLKVLHLAPLFKDQDWEGLTEVLSAITEATKRDELPVLIEALQEKRKRIDDFQQEIDNKLSALQRKEKEIAKAKEDIEKAQESIQQQLQFLSKYNKDVQVFLADHLGIAKNGELCLAKRLDYRWQKNLQKKGIISFYKPNAFSYNEADQDRAYIYFIKDLEGLVEDLKKRWKRGWDTRWDYEKESKRVENNAFIRWDAPVDPAYRNAEGLATDLRSEIDYCNKRIKEIEAERQAIQKEMKQLRKTSPQSFIEQVEASNTLSAHDLKRHGEMQDKALKWLYNKGYIVASEVTLPNNKRADVIGYNESGHIIIVEVKVTASDFLQDKKWESYLEYCDEFYFLLNNEIRRAYYQAPYVQKDKKAGLLEELKNTLRVKEDHTWQHTANDREKVQFLISKVLTKRYVYGY